MTLHKHRGKGKFWYIYEHTHIHAEEARWDEKVVTNILPAHGVNCDSEAENRKGR